jgi:mannan endo-1,4-beta-mannosidase
MPVESVVARFGRVGPLAVAGAGLLLALMGAETVDASPKAAPLGERVRFGAYAPGLPYRDAAFLELEGANKLGTKVDIASGFVDFEYVLGEERDVKLADGGSRTLLYSWEPHCINDHRCIGFHEIITGRVDPYLERVAQSMRQFPHEIYVRPWAEMNASWSPYQPGSGRPRAGSLDEFKAAWRYLHDFFRRRGVHNLKFVFNPDVTQTADDVRIDQLWPGQDARDGHRYVEVLGIDGYNWGESGPGGHESWVEFEELFRDTYRILTALEPDAPVWICEFGTKEPLENDGTANSPAPRDPHHSKGKWFDNMFRTREFPRLEALAYYSSYLPDHDNQRDFRLDSSDDSLKAVRRYLKNRKRKPSAK